MKKLSEFSWRELKRFIITLKSQLALITNDNDLKSAIKAFQDVRNGQETDITYIDAAYAIIDSLFTTNENALDIIAAACMQVTVEELQEIDNVNIIETVIDFFSIEKYKELFLRATELDTKDQ